MKIQITNHIIAWHGGLYFNGFLYFVFYWFVHERQNTRQGTFQWQG